MLAMDPTLLTEDYQLRETFDVSRQIDALQNLPGVAYMRFDQTFYVYQKQPAPKAVSASRSSR
jgi:hypothetical protein